MLVNPRGEALPDIQSVVEYIACKKRREEKRYDCPKLCEALKLRPYQASEASHGTLN